jgi:hypothetical protein
MSYHLRPALKCDKCGALWEHVELQNRDADGRTGPTANVIRSLAMNDGWRTITSNSPTGSPFPARRDYCPTCKGPA